MDAAEVPAVEAVRAQLEEDIVFGHLKPRERLVEDDLMARFGAKRHVVREALAALERIGIVERRRNRGAAVRDYPPEEVAQIFAVRELLERRAAELIPLPNPALLAALEEIHGRYCAAADAGDLRQVFRLNMAFHETLFAGCGNPHLSEAIATHARKAHGIRFYAIGTPTLLAQARREHEAMLWALREGERAALVGLCVEHLKASPRAYAEAYRRLYP